MTRKVAIDFGNNKLSPFVRLLTINVCVCDGLYMLGPGSGTIRGCGPVGVGVSLWLFKK